MGASTALFEDLICFGQNKFLKEENFTLGGPCFTVINVLNTTLKGVNVEMGFAYSNTVGLKLIFNESTGLEEKGALTSPEVLLINKNISKFHLSKIK